VRKLRTATPAATKKIMSGRAIMWVS